MCHTYRYTYPCSHTRTLLSSTCVDLRPRGISTAPLSSADDYGINDDSTHPNTIANHATSCQDLGDPGDGCRVCMVRDGVLEVEELARPCTRVARAGVRAGRDEEMAARWGRLPNHIIAPPAGQAPTATATAAATPSRHQDEMRAAIAERVRELAQRQTLQGTTISGPSAVSCQVSSPGGCPSVTPTAGPR